MAIIEIFQFDFMQNALVAALLASIACGIIGSYVVSKKLVSISGGIAHSVFGGVGLGYFIDVHPMSVVIPFSLLCAVGIGWISKKTRIPSDTAIGIFWALGMALGVIFISLVPGYVPDLFAYLFGNILTVSSSDLVLMAIFDAIMAILVFLFYRQFLAISFDEEFAEAIGLPVTWLYYLLLCLIALTVVALIRIVGTILVITLLALPAATSKQFVKRFDQMVYLSILIGLIDTTIGLLLSYYFDLASGATIILFATSVFLLTALIRRFQQKINS